MHPSSHMHLDLHHERQRDLIASGERGRLRAMLRRRSADETYTPAGEPRGDRPAVLAPSGAQHQRGLGARPGHAESG
jgi:hypothetical protein